MAWQPENQTEPMRFDAPMVKVKDEPPDDHEAKPAPQPKRIKSDLDVLIEQFKTKAAPLIRSWSERWPAVPQEPVAEYEASELYAIMPPLEMFMGVSADRRRQQFYQHLKQGDILIGKITRKTETGFLINALCFEPPKQRDLSDLELRMVCLYKQAPPLKRGERVQDAYNESDLVRVVVITYVPEEQKIIVSMRPEALEGKRSETIKLGLIEEQELPLHYTKAKKYIGRNYHDVLNRQLSFSNPESASFLSSRLVQPPPKCHLSFLPELSFVQYEEQSMAKSLRKVQSTKSASKSIEQGVKHLKESNFLGAIQMLNHALKIDPESVDAYVVRGCAYANNGSLQRSLEDFERALDLNPGHSNARKYMSSTLVELGRQLMENDDNLPAAAESFRRALAINKENEEALDSLAETRLKLDELRREQARADSSKIKRQSSSGSHRDRSPEPHSSRSQSTPNRSESRSSNHDQTSNTKEKLKHLLQDSRSSSKRSRSSSERSDSSSDSNSDNRSHRRHHHKHKSKKSHKKHKRSSKKSDRKKHKRKRSRPRSRSRSRDRGQVSAGKPLFSPLRRNKSDDEDPFNEIFDDRDKDKKRSSTSTKPDASAPSRPQIRSEIRKVMFSPVRREDPLDLDDIPLPDSPAPRNLSPDRSGHTPTRHPSDNEGPSWKPDTSEGVRFPASDIRYRDNPLPLIEKPQYPPGFIPGLGLAAPRPNDSYRSDNYNSHGRSSYDHRGYPSYREQPGYRGGYQHHHPNHGGHNHKRSGPKPMSGIYEGFGFRPTHPNQPATPLPGPSRGRGNGHGSHRGGRRGWVHMTPQLQERLLQEDADDEAAIMAAAFGHVDDTGPPVKPEIKSEVKKERR